MNHLIYIYQDDGQNKEIEIAPGQRLCDIAAAIAPTRYVRA